MAFMHKYNFNSCKKDNSYLLDSPVLRMTSFLIWFPNIHVASVGTSLQFIWLAGGRACGTSTTEEAR